MMMTKMLSPLKTCGATLVLALAAAVSPSSTASAQTLLGGAEFGAKLPFGFSVGAGVEYRSRSWFDHTDQWSAEVSAAYKPLKPLKIGLSYKFIQSNEPATRFVHDYWTNRHRVSLGVTGEWKPIKILTLSLRERYQYTYRSKLIVPRWDEDGAPDGNKTVAAKSKHILRSRLMAEVKPYKKCRFTPYVSYELYSQLKDVNHTKAEKTTGAKFYDKWRLTAGSGFRINRHNSLDLFYRYCSNADADALDEPHTIGLVYKFKL